jgi:hypothetical protein
MHANVSSILPKTHFTNVIFFGERLRYFNVKCSGFFSTMSSGLNSLAAVVWEDLVKPMGWSSSISEGRQVFLTRAIASFMGLVTVGMAVIAANLDGVLQLGNTAMGVLAGPLLAVFLLGFFTTAANKYVIFLNVDRLYFLKD